MKTLKSWVTTVTVMTLACSASEVSADSIRLANGDVIRGNVVSLTDQELTIRSDNFGEMKVPREKVEIVVLGDKSIEEMFPAPQAQQPIPAPSGGGDLPSMQHPQVQQQLNRLMQEALGGGIGGVGTMQHDLEKTQRGLRELQRDLGPGSSADALDGYIKLFQMFGGGAGAAGADAGGAAATPQSEAAPGDDR
jgi:hypothetical protein